MTTKNGKKTAFPAVQLCLVLLFLLGAVMVFAGRKGKTLYGGAGSGAEKVIKTTCFLAEIADFAAFNGVYAKYFTSKPARSCVAVKDLPKGALCEIECIAEL